MLQCASCFPITALLARARMPRRLSVPPSPPVLPPTQCVQIRDAFLKVEAEYKAVTGKHGATRGSGEGEARGTSPHRHAATASPAWAL